MGARNYSSDFHSGSVAQGTDDQTVDHNLTVSNNLAVTGTATVTGNVTHAGSLLSTGRISATITTNKTLAEGDSGILQKCATDGVIFTLPATVVGMTFTIINTGAAGAAAIAYAPNASDKIMGNGYTSADNKAVTNTKATAVTGDRMTLVGDGVNGWFIVDVVGIWAKTP